jgi:hypothetical protein
MRDLCVETEDGLVMTVFPKVIPAGILYLHGKAASGEADHYGVRMFTFNMSDQLQAVSPVFEGAEKVWLLYRLKGKK